MLKPCWHTATLYNSFPNYYSDSSNDSVSPRHMQEHVAVAIVFLPGMIYDKCENWKERTQCMVQTLSPSSFLSFLSSLSPCFAWYLVGHKADFHYRLGKGKTTELFIFTLYIWFSSSGVVAQPQCQGHFNTLIGSHYCVTFPISSSNLSRRVIPLLYFLGMGFSILSLIS